MTESENRFAPSEELPLYCDVLICPAVLTMVSGVDRAEHGWGRISVYSGPYGQTDWDLCPEHFGAVVAVLQIEKGKKRLSIENAPGSGQRFRQIDYAALEAEVTREALTIISTTPVERRRGPGRPRKERVAVPPSSARIEVEHLSGGQVNLIRRALRGLVPDSHAWQREIRKQAKHYGVGVGLVKRLCREEAMPWD
jgi:hypothetical protein